MYIGRSGKFVLKAPFTKYGAAGLTGKIVEVVFIQSAVSDGQDILNEVYQPVAWLAGYSDDFNDNVIIITISSGGRLYRIPDTYIENLNDDSTKFGNAYCTVKIGLLPYSYDFTSVAAAMATEVSKVTGLVILPSEVSIHMSELSGTVKSRVETAVETVKRKVKTQANEGNLAKITKIGKKLNVSEDKLSALSKGYAKLSKYL